MGRRDTRMCQWQWVTCASVDSPYPTALARPPRREDKSSGALERTTPIRADTPRHRVLYNEASEVHFVWRPPYCGEGMSAVLQ